MPGRQHGFGARLRIKQRRDFLRIQEHGRKLRSEHFLLAIVHRRGTEGQTLPARLGLTVTTKVDKRSARRNRLKRRLRELFRTKVLPKISDKDLVIIALTGAVELSYQEIAEEVEQLLVRARLLPRKRPPRSGPASDTGSGR